MSILQEAEGLIHGDRHDTYGHPAKDFDRVTAAAKALGVDPRSGGALHHCLYMVLVKIARLVETPGHRDSCVDGAGYFGTYDMIMEHQGGW